MTAPSRTADDQLAKMLRGAPMSGLRKRQNQLFHSVNVGNVPEGGFEDSSIEEIRSFWMTFHLLRPVPKVHGQVAKADETFTGTVGNEHADRWVVRAPH